MGITRHEFAPSLFSKTRQALLSLLYTHSDESFFLEQLIQSAALGRGSVQRELEFLTRAGIVRRTKRGRQVYFQANADCPVYPELKGLVIKTTGIADVLRSALAPLAAHIDTAFIYGSIARGTERKSSDVDVMVIGEATFSEVSDALTSAQRTIGREINPSVYPPKEFHRKLAAKHHFLISVLKSEKIFLIGDTHELARLAKK